DSRIHRAFDVAIDRGCLHLLDPDAAVRYAENVAALVSPGGFLLLKTHDIQEENRHGTTPYTRAALEDLFGGAFDVVEEHASDFPGPIETPAARLFVLRRTTAA